MKHGRLTRIVSIPEHGTFGCLVLEGVPFCVTLEPYTPIPAWQYIAKPYQSPIHGSVYLLEHVSGRTFIELHPGNRDGDTHGCVLLAEKFGKLYGDIAVLNSGATFKKFLSIMSGDTLTLTVQEAL